MSGRDISVTFAERECLRVGESCHGDDCVEIFGIRQSENIGRKYITLAMDLRLCRFKVRILTLAKQSLSCLL